MNYQKYEKANHYLSHSSRFPLGGKPPSSFSLQVSESPFVINFRFLLGKKAGKSLHLSQTHIDIWDLLWFFRSFEESRVLENQLPSPRLGAR